MRATHGAEPNRDAIGASDTGFIKYMPWAYATNGQNGL